MRRMAGAGELVEVELCVHLLDRRCGAMGAEAEQASLGSTAKADMCCTCGIAEAGFGSGGARCRHLSEARIGEYWVTNATS